MKKCLICNNEAARGEVCTDCHIIAEGKSYSISRYYQKAEINSFSRKINYIYVNSNHSRIDIKSFLIATYSIVLLARRNNDAVTEKRYLEKLVTRKKEYEGNYFSPKNKLLALIAIMDEASAESALRCLSFYQELYKGKMRTTYSSKEELRELITQSSEISIISETLKLKIRFAELWEQIELDFVIR